jgi:polyhydroxyalkanoate synthase subunit PhaC
MARAKTSTKTAAVLPGTRERSGSPWLGPSGLALEAPAAPRTVPAPARATSEPLADSWLPFGQVAPATAVGALADWWVHLAASPAKQWDLAHRAARQWVRALAAFAGQKVIRPLPQDKRFDDPAWQAAPFHALAQAFMLQQQWWHRATTGVPGVTRHHEDMVSFAARQWLDMVAPTNFIATNPVARQRTVREGGLNLLRGGGHLLEDLRREALDIPPVGAEQFEPGVNVAVTPGRVVLRNRLMELIQYAPTTRKVHAEPVLLVPAWIMKYYVLDLSPHNSLVRYLVEQGFTVFAISWKNPDSSDRDLDMDDYARLGVLDALEAIERIVPGAGVHAAGYCLGGTLLASVAARLGRDGRMPLRSVTLLAAQTDFTEPGELALFVDEGQIAFLERLMRQHGYLDKRHMKSAFQLLRSNDLVWSYRLRSYLLGERYPFNDLMAWNADGTRLPCRMHSEYLRGLFLDNALARGEWRVEGVRVNLSDIRVPVFNLGAVQDHVAPWRSVYKLLSLTDAQQTFMLTAGGHNVGVVNPPGSTQSSYRLRTHHPGDRLLSADEWLEATPSTAGSWWPAWSRWLAGHSGRLVPPPTLGNPKHGLPPKEPAPGLYVHQR